MNKRTRGPWVNHSPDNAPLGAVLVSGASQQCNIYMAPRTRETEANASLIAAAPDLLEALQGLLKDALQNGYDETHQEVKDARAAIAKAEDP